MKWKEPLSIHHLTLTNRIVMPPTRVCHLTRYFE